METKATNWKAKQQLVDQYSHDFSQVSTMFDYNPWDRSAVDQRVAWLDEATHLRVERERLAHVMKEYNERMLNHHAALENVTALADEKTLVVVGGQQAGLLTGPKLVIYKAITLIQLAKRESARLQRKVVPVFWIAGEDHDFEEVNHTYFLTKENDIEKIKLGHSSDRRPSISHLEIDHAEWSAVLEQVDTALIHTEFKQEIMEKLASFSMQSRTLSDFFARIMAWLFGHHGLVLLDSADSLLRRLETPMFEKLIAHSSVINKALISGKEKLEALGYSVQAEVREKQANLFVTHEGQRLLLFGTSRQLNDGINGLTNGGADERTNDLAVAGYEDRRSEVYFTKDELLDVAKTTPERLSNNVFTRPLMQEFLFPVLHTVLGPGEIAYWGLLRDAFHTLDMRMPIITKRTEYTLLEGTTQKHMNKYDMTFTDVIHSFHAKKEAWLHAQDNLQLIDRFEDAKLQFENIYNPLLDSLASIHQGIRNLGETNKQKILEQIEFLQGRAQDAFQSQHEASLRQLDRIALSILPLGKAQERVYNIFGYLNKYGLAWLDELVTTHIDDPKLHIIVYV